jgi:hypothetical protein
MLHVAGMLGFFLYSQLLKMIEKYNAFRSPIPAENAEMKRCFVGEYLL